MNDEFLVVIEYANNNDNNTNNGIRDSSFNLVRCGQLETDDTHFAPKWNDQILP